MADAKKLEVCRLDLSDPGHAKALIELLDHYARDPMGGAAGGLNEGTRLHLVERLQYLPAYHGGIAWCDGQAVGLINCFTGFSTFAARPLLNVHDLVVLRQRRGCGIGQAMLAWAESTAREVGCCKLTLEVLSGNRKALAAYERAGFRPYVLDPDAGQALFLEKRL
jgi:GNAT superfamily N-acetyltransferase